MPVGVLLPRLVEDGVTPLAVTDGAFAATVVAPDELSVSGEDESMVTALGAVLPARLVVSFDMLVAVVVVLDFPALDGLVVLGELGADVAAALGLYAVFLQCLDSVGDQLVELLDGVLL